ncbi:MAG: hypothetical protein OXH57_06670 [Ekhidna sp.]|nr:hypothetical protein [Ekhidna sp.]
MMDKKHLHLLINEKIYLINEGERRIVFQEDTKIEPQTDPSQTSSEEPENSHSEAEDENLNERTVPLAIFHESSSESDLELLQKIIEACKLEKDSYTVFGNGFNKTLKFRKALVFVAKSTVFYEPIPYQESRILFAKPLGQISNDQQEKKKLWRALQAFV